MGCSAVLSGRLLLPLLMLCPCAAASAQSADAAAHIVTLKVNPSETYQTIDNFTASDAWSGEFVGRCWSGEVKSQIARWLFSRETDDAGNPCGIGLSMWRVNLGGGTLEQENPDIMPFQRRAESYLTVSGDGYDWDKCPGQRWFVSKAAELGCNNFLLFSNTPPVQFTLNGRGWAPSTDRANLREDRYGDFAAYLADVAAHFTENGWKVSYISPINEPNVRWNSPRQEGSSWRIDEMYRLFSELDSALSSRQGLDSVKIAVGESGDLKFLYSTSDYLRQGFGGCPELAPAFLVKHFWEPESPYCLAGLKHVPRLVVGHDYWSEITNRMMVETRRKVREVCGVYGVRFQQSEWCLLPPSLLRVKDGMTPDWDGTDDIQVALVMGRLIHSDMTVADAEAWGYWKAMELNGDHALIALRAEDGDILKGGTASANKILWALGNYSFFIRPGFVRIGCDGADDLDGLAVSAYMSPERDRIVLVGVNSGFSAENISLSLPSGVRRRVSSVNVYRTDAVTDLTLVSSFQDVPGQIEAAQRSLTTIVLDLRKPEYDTALIPHPVFDAEPGYVELYWKAWEQAYDHVKWQKGLVQPLYMDEGLWDDTIWIWDSEFMVMFCKYAPKLYPGIQTLDNFYCTMLENSGSSLRIQHPDNPPFFAWVENDYLKLTGDVTHVRELLMDKKYLQRYWDLFPTLSPERKLQFDHYPMALRYKGIGYEWNGVSSGMDNTPRTRAGEGMLWVDAISQQALSALYISRLARAVGDRDTEREYLGKWKELRGTVNRFYWDDSTGCYYDIVPKDGHASGEDVPDSPSEWKTTGILTPASFWPMLAEIPSERQARRMADFALAPDKLGGEVPWVTVSRDDQDFDSTDGQYWRGAMWLPTAYMGIKALEKYGMTEAADTTAERVLSWMLRTYGACEPHTIWECYSPVEPAPSVHHGKRVRPDFCGWSALGPISLFIENVLGFHDIDALSRTVRWDIRHSCRHGLENLSFGDTKTSLVYDPASSEVKVRSDRPYTLILNGKKHKIKEGTTTIPFLPQ